MFLFSGLFPVQKQMLEMNLCEIMLCVKLLFYNTDSIAVIQLMNQFIDKNSHQSKNGPSTILCLLSPWDKLWKNCQENF